jgi:hypothetical protein
LLLAFGIVAEINQAVAIGDLYVDKTQHRETKNAGRFRTNSVTQGDAPTVAAQAEVPIASLFE